MLMIQCGRHAGVELYPPSQPRISWPPGQHNMLYLQLLCRHGRRRRCCRTVGASLRGQSRGQNSRERLRLCRSFEPSAAETADGHESIGSNARCAARVTKTNRSTCERYAAGRHMTTAEGASCCFGGMRSMAKVLVTGATDSSARS